MDEEWKPVVGYEAHYEVSSLGCVRRIKPGRGATAGRILRPSMQGEYLAVSLYKNDCKKKIGVHILVAEAFHGGRPIGLLPNHKDTNKLNNAADNLEWVSRIENARHAVSNGIVGGKPQPGELNGRAKLTMDQVYKIRDLKGIVGQRSIAIQFGVSRTAVQLIHQGKNWRTEWPEDIRVREFPTQG